MLAIANTRPVSRQRSVFHVQMLERKVSRVSNRALPPSWLVPFLRQTLRITSTDIRIFLVAFAGKDKPLHVVLVNAEEFRIDYTSDNADLDAVEQDQQSAWRGMSV
ncbi:hypothetical protein BDZ89DRAFT_149905 [Hymenopellis radicata]|nr:hypothetical protein BDZ89DRAFT_149905 [Hymenopellis radicata]